MHDYAVRSGGSFPVAVTPSGFTLISNQQAPDTNYTSRTVTSCKIATGAEASASITGMVGNFEANKELLVFRLSVPATSVSVSTVSSQSTNAAPTNQNVAASGGIAPLVVIATYGVEDAIAASPRTFSPAPDGEVSARTNSITAYLIQNASPADVTAGLTDKGRANTLQSFYLAIA